MMSASDTVGNELPRAYIVRSTCGRWKICLSGRGITRIVLPPCPPPDGRLFKWGEVVERRGRARTPGRQPRRHPEKGGIPPALNRLMTQITHYFSGVRKRLIVPCTFHGGTPFMKKVWECMRRIPFGETVTYGDLASSAGFPEACRVVGNACAANPLPLLVPCHRVVGKRGMGGFSAGKKWKRFLLSIEARGHSGADEHVSGSTLQVTPCRRKKV